MATIKSIEEKAQRYDESIERAKRVLLDCTSEERKVVEYITPELAESEDEKIRKELVQFFEEKDEEDFEEWIPKAKVLAWLEKQGEHAKFRDSIQVGDKVTRNEDGVLVNLSQLNRVAKKDEKKGEQKLTEFERAVKQVMEEAIECGDTHNLKADAEMLLSLVHKSAWSEEDDIMKQNCHQMLALLRPNSSELIKDIIDNCYHWLEALKDRVPQPKQEWNEEEQKIIKDAACIIFDCVNTAETEKEKKKT